MSKIDYVTLQAAHRFSTKECGKRPITYISLGVLKETLFANQKKPANQGWSFAGTQADWKRCVQPYFGRA